MLKSIVLIKQRIMSGKEMKETRKKTLSESQLVNLKKKAREREREKAA